MAAQETSLIRVFAVHMKKAWVLSHPLSAERRLIRLGGRMLGAQQFCWFCHETAQMSLFKVCEVGLESQFGIRFGGLLELG